MKIDNVVILAGVLCMIDFKELKTQRRARESRTLRDKLLFKPFECTLCHKKFSQRQMLTQHRMYSSSCHYIMTPELETTPEPETIPELKLDDAIDMNVFLYKPIVEFSQDEREILNQFNDCIRVNDNDISCQYCPAYSPESAYGNLQEVISHLFTSHGNTELDNLPYLFDFK